MNEKLRKWLEQNGLRAEATDQEAWALYDQMVKDGVELPGIDPGQRSQTPGEPGGEGAAPPAGGEGGEGGASGEGSQPAGQRTYSAAELEAIVDQRTVQVMAAEATRRNEVQQLLDVAGLNELDNGDFARNLLSNTEVHAARASQLIMTELQTRQIPIGTGAQVGTTAPEKARDAVRDGLMLRAGLAVETPAPGANDFRGRSMLEIGREVLEINGVSTRGMGRRAIAELMLSPRSVSSLSTFDFSNIFSPLVNKVLLRAYTEWPATWRPIVAVGEANDFKDIHAIKLSGSPDLQGLTETGEYKTAVFSDSGETYRVITKGIRVPLTRTMIINDDLRAFTRVPRLFGVAARRMENVAVYTLITNNPTMSDGTALFHADHKNLAGTGTALSSGTLSTGRSAMRKQTGLAGESIDAMPAFVLTSVEKETDAEILLRSAALPDDNKSAAVHNPWAGKLTPISDPLLAANPWYLFAHPDQLPVIEVAWLEGEEQPYVEEQVDFNSDSLVIKVRHDFGAGVVDHVGAYKNPGA